MTAQFRISLVTATIATLYAGTWHAQAKYVQTSLVSEITELATVTDPQLHSPWGISHSDMSPSWVSNQGANTATLYSVTAGNDLTKVNIDPPSGFGAIPQTASGPQGPTGQVANTNTSAFPGWERRSFCLPI